MNEKESIVLSKVNKNRVTPISGHSWMVKPLPMVFLTAIEMLVIPNCVCVKSLSYWVK